MFIVFDGPDGAGKSTQIRLAADRLAESGADVARCRDPGGTAIGDRIREILLGHDLERMDVRCETLLFLASRAQLISEVIRPAQADGKTVLCDRFTSATCAYQGAAGLNPQKVIELAAAALEPVLWPDLTIIFDVDPVLGLSRAAGRSGSQKHSASNSPAPGQSQVSSDAMESRSIEFHQRVRQLFLELPLYYPTPVVVVDGGCDVKSVSESAWQAILDCSKKR